jgi:hypothetical protein
MDLDQRLRHVWATHPRLTSCPIRRRSLKINTGLAILQSIVAQSVG